VFTTIRHSGAVGLSRNVWTFGTKPATESAAATAVTPVTITRPRHRSVVSTWMPARTITNGPSVQTGVAKRNCSIQSGMSTPNAASARASGMRTRATAVPTPDGGGGAAARRPTVRAAGLPMEARSVVVAPRRPVPAAAAPVALAARRSVAAPEVLAAVARPAAPASAAPTRSVPTSTIGQPAYAMRLPTFANPATVGSPCDFAIAVVGSHCPKVASRHAR